MQPTVRTAQPSPLTVARLTTAAVLMEEAQLVDHSTRAVPKTKANHPAHGAGTHGLESLK